MSSHDRERRLDDESLVQWLLDPALRDRWPREELSAADREALTEWEGVVSAARAGLGDERFVCVDAANRVTEAVLTRTLREDLGWRGDLRLVRGFVGRRLRASLVLRVAAASLLVHLVALPVLAVYGTWKERREGPRILVELPSDTEPPFAEPAREHVPEPEAPALPALDSIGSDSFAVQNAVNADRWSVFLRREQLRAVARGDWTTPTERRLAVRAARLIGDPAPSIDGGMKAPLDGLLALDAALDARLNGRPLLVDAEDLERLADDARGESGRAILARLVLRRAARYGADLPDGVEALLGPSDPSSELGDGRLAPLSAEWIRALRDAAPHGAVSPAIVDALSDE